MELIKKLLPLSLLLTSLSVSALDITLSKSIKSDLRSKIEDDLTFFETIKFDDEAMPETLKLMGLETLTNESATQWLNARVKYIVSEKSTSKLSQFFYNNVYVSQKNIDYPNPTIIPYPNQDLVIPEKNPVNHSGDEPTTILNNLSSSFYIGGKLERSIYAMKISRGFFKKAERVEVLSPRAGIVQIGEGFFDIDLEVNREDINAYANRIFRYSALFHEARHSDGNGESLGFLHAVCPKGHDYEGALACDEMLNGSYAIQAQMIRELSKTCEDNCSERDKQMLKLVAIDSANRILLKTHKGEKTKAWDPKPESL